MLASTACAVGVDGSDTKVTLLAIEYIEAGDAQKLPDKWICGFDLQHDASKKEVMERRLSWPCTVVQRANTGKV